MSPLAWLGALLPVTAVCLLLQATRWDRRGVPTPVVLVAALAVGLGLGLGSTAFFVSLVAFNGARTGVLAVDLGLLLFAVACWWRSDSPGAAAAARRSPPATSSDRPVRDSILAAAVAVAALAGAAAFAANTLAGPHGEWDAWAIWNLRARWLFRAGAAWRTAVGAETIHGDYPLLLPGAVARLWVYAGADATIVPVELAAAYAAALVLLLYGALAAIRGRTQGLLAALCLLGTPVFLTSAAWQYADIPLAFFLLAALGLLAIRDCDPGSSTVVLAWAGAAAGLAAWTKNEGLLFLLCLALARGGRAAVRRRWVPRSAAWFLAGLLPPAAAFAYFKLALAPPTYEFTHQGDGGLLGRLGDPDRYTAIAGAAGRTLIQAGGLVLIALTLYAVLLGRTGDRRARRTGQATALALGLVALGYGAVYLITPADLDWQLSHSVDRLVLQLWPSLLFTFFLYTASPAEVDARAPALRRAPRSRAPSAPARTRHNSTWYARNAPRRRSRRLR